MQSQMRVEQRPETVDEDHGAEVGRCTGAGTVLSQYPLDGGQKYTQCGVQNRRIVLQVIAQALGNGEHPLMEQLAIRLSEQTTLAKSLVMAHRQTRDDVVGQMRRLALHYLRGVDHAAGSAGRADAAALVTEGNPRGTGVSDQEVVPAVGAAGTGETMSEDAALEVSATARRAFFARPPCSAVVSSAAEFPLGDGGCACPGAILLKR